MLPRGRADANARRAPAAGRPTRAGALAVVALGLWFGLAPATVRAAPDDDTRAAEAVQRHLGLYLTLPAQRDEDERVTQTGGRVEAWFLQPLGAKPERTLCSGLRWLLLGRLAASDGAAGLFAALPEVQEVTLVFYAIETQVDPDAEGRYRQRRSAAPVARFALSRDRAAQLDPRKLRDTLTGARCLSVGQRLVDSLWQR